ncbi:hypothetical protein DU002_01315 [Corallincola holothuriorum]|uniref:Uncharacterized protein n=1 Tax=Corallincola holothuriorum TaxID=2282215 RepID=A0A368NQG0_9GAMM|nr:hypothetical protein [Corallincola holothuriorum]RCU52638.1 hypothetical protein DU002_01315 [Corallincola holothuriorum]
MELTASFTASPAHTACWEALLQGLENEEVGAIFQDRVLAAFGKAADEALDKLLQFYPPSCFIAEDWGQEGNRFEWTMALPGAYDCLAGELQQWLQLCGAEQIEVIPSPFDDC